MQPMIKLIENYSDKGIAVIGNTFPIKEELKALNGSFNRALKYEGLTVAGWVFSKNRIEAIRQLVLRHSNPTTLSPEPVIMVRDEKPKVEPSKQVKPVVKTQQTGFKMLVKCTGFIELEREFTSEQVMNKFLNDLRKQREVQVDSKLGILRKGATRLSYYSGYGTEEARKEKIERAENELKQQFIKANILPLKIEFNNLLTR